MAAKHNPRDCVARYGDCGGCDEEVPRRGQRALGTGANPPPIPTRPRTITIPPKEVEALVANIVESNHVPTHEPDSAPTIVIEAEPPPLQSEAARDLARAWASSPGSGHSNAWASTIGEGPKTEGERQVRNVFGGNVDLSPGTVGAAIAETVNVMGRNHMPPELAARMLEAHNVRTYDDVTPEQCEALTLLTEECAEVTQRATKIQRFGKGARPGDTVTNTRLLSEEIGHVLASIDLCVQHGLVDSRYMGLARARKLEDYSRPEGVTRRQSLRVRESLAMLARVFFDRLTKRKLPDGKPTLSPSDLQK